MKAGPKRAEGACANAQTISTITENTAIRVPTSIVLTRGGTHYRLDSNTVIPLSCDNSHPEPKTRNTFLGQGKQRESEIGPRKSQHWHSGLKRR